MSNTAAELLSDADEFKHLKGYQKTNARKQKESAKLREIFTEICNSSTVNNELKSFLHKLEKIDYKLSKIHAQNSEPFERSASLQIFRKVWDILQKNPEIFEAYKQLKPDYVKAVRKMQNFNTIRFNLNAKKWNIKIKILDNYKFKFFNVLT